MDSTQKGVSFGRKIKAVLLFWMINNASLLHWSLGGKKAPRNEVFDMMPECHRLSSHPLTRAGAVTAHKKSHLFTAGHLGAPRATFDMRVKTKGRDAAKHEHLLHAETLNQLLHSAKRGIFPGEPHGVNKAGLCDGGGLAGTDRGLPTTPSEAGASLWVIRGAPF